MSEEAKKQAAQQKINQNSVMRYLTILFAAAFVLLLFTFAMERRQYEALQAQRQEQIDDLQEQSLTAGQSLSNLYEENIQMKDELNKMTIQLENAQETLVDTQSELDTLLEQLNTETARVNAMDWFWQINEAYVRSRTDLCVELIHSMEKLELVKFLPRESTTDTDRYAPYDRFMEIRNKLIPSEDET